MKRDPIKEAMNAQTNLNIFAAVEVLLEGGTIYGRTPAAAGKIIAICRAEQQRQLRIMDKAVADANRVGA